MGSRFISFGSWDRCSFLMDHSKWKNKWSYGCLMIPTILWRDQKFKPLNDFKPPSTSSGHPQHEARLQAVAPGHGRKKKKESCRGNPRIVLIFLGSFLGSFLAKAARYLTSTSMWNTLRISEYLYIWLLFYVSVVFSMKKIQLPPDVRKEPIHWLSNLGILP